MGHFGDNEAPPSLDDLKGHDTGMLLNPIASGVSRLIHDIKVVGIHFRDTLVICLLIPLSGRYRGEGH
jgi:hypothetical protein